MLKSTIYAVMNLLVTYMGNYTCSYNIPDMFHILSLVLPTISDLSSKTNAAAVREFYLTFINIILPDTVALSLDTNFIWNL